MKASCRSLCIPKIGLSGLERIYLGHTKLSSGLQFILGLQFKSYICKSYHHEQKQVNIA
jgi:hypothetical protein